VYAEAAAAARAGAAIDVLEAVRQEVEEQELACCHPLPSEMRVSPIAAIDVLEAVRQEVEEQDLACCHPLPSEMRVSPIAAIGVLDAVRP
jgi:HAMP domain-containing protein